ncbi:MAG: DUF2939 domain-containing protein [Methyloceanibacter sp.]
MRKWLVVAAVLAAAYVGYPYLTLYWIDQALLNDDRLTLQRLVDFQGVRTRMKDDLKEAALDKAQRQLEKRPIVGVFSTALAALVVPPVVEGAVDKLFTPDAIMNSEIVDEHRRQNKSFADFVTYAFFSGPTIFRVDLKDPQDPDSPTLTAVMELLGPRWRVVKVDLPPVRTWFPEGEAPSAGIGQD